MGKVIWNFTMSLDGFIAGPDDAMDWVFRYDGPNPAVDEVIESTGSVLAGRRSYDVGNREGQRPEAGEVFGGAWTGPEFVLTHHAPDVADPTVTFLSDGVRTAVATALDAADGKDVLLIGADLAQQCIEAGLIDEMVVLVVPILLGDGVRFFGRPGAAPVDLEPISVTRGGPTTNLRFRVVKWPPRVGRWC